MIVISNVYRSLYPVYAPNALILNFFVPISVFDVPLTIILELSVESRVIQAGKGVPS